MNRVANKNKTNQGFHLSKWFLDFTGYDGETMIFYSANMKWHHIPVEYTSWLHYKQDDKVKSGYRFSRVQEPKRNLNKIIWNDLKFGFSGVWRAAATPISARIFESSEGFLEWNCFQPAAKVQIETKEGTKTGWGYAEQLILTVPPWKIPMDELRWGRFISDTDHIVWIELKSQETRNWMWRNSERVNLFSIGDKQLTLPDIDLNLALDQRQVLESEKKIASVTGKIVRFIPGFNKFMPVNFLLSDETKWLSRGTLTQNGITKTEGFAIHELVQFNSNKQ